MKKKTQLFLLLLLLLCFPELVTGQEEKSPYIYHSFTYETGITRMKEKILFPIVHKGSVNGLTYRYEKRGKNYHEIFVSLRYSKIKTDLETEKVSQNVQFGIGYCMGFLLVINEKMNYYLGYNLRYAHSLAEFPVWDESRAYWATSLTSGISNRLFINNKTNQSWFFSWDINPMGLYSRPDEVRIYAQENWSLSSILKTTNSNIKPGLINNVLLSNFRTEYRFHSKNDNYFALLYSFSYSRICTTNEQPQMNSISNFGISLGF
ncbi:MAG TPA: hypothetical protein VMV47_00525 [Bacteroidales bacterium]|nr:hypothetical protein [Bacteroidales bacterium]